MIRGGPRRRGRGGRRGDRGDGARRLAYRLRLVAHDPAAYDWYYNVVANPMLWFIAALSLGPRERAGRRPRAPPRVERGLRGGEPGFADAVVEELERQPGRGRLLPRLPPLPRAAPRPRARAGRDARRTSSTSRGRSRTTGGCCRTRSAARSTRGCSRTTSSASTRRRWRQNFLRCCAEILDVELDAAASEVRVGGHGRPRALRARSRSTRTSSTSSPRARPCSQPEAAIERRAARVPRPPRRPHRSVEERRARLPGVRRSTSSPPGDARARPDARAARPVAAGHPRVRGVPRRDPARSAGGQRPLPAGGLEPARPPDRGRLPAGGRRLQAVRRPARERDLRRAQPRRQGGAARQHARRGARPLGERRRARGARPTGR